jgi:class 3 adenylate cyclase/predicted ATPase
MQPLEREFRFEGFTLDLRRGCLRDAGGEIELRPKSFEVLRYLVENAGRLVAKDELIKAVWPNVVVTDESLTRCVSDVRLALGDRQQRIIRTMPRRGYLLAVPVSQAAWDAPSSDHDLSVIARSREPAAERRRLTVMCCGLVGSTALASRLDPEDLRAVIADYRRCCSELIGRFGGMVAPFSGDHVVAYFGYPEAHEDDAERGVRAGLALIDAVAELKFHLAPPLRVRIGISSGLVVFGGTALGEAGREPIAIGEAPDLAARLLGLAPADAVVIAASTRQHVRGLFDYREVGRVSLEGLAEPVAAWQVVGTSAAASRFEALREGRSIPLIGRDEEIDLLLRRWQQIQSGEGRVVLISGEPGIGKSRLVRALQDRLANDAVLSFYCSPIYQDTPLFPVIAQLERSAGFRRTDTPEQRLAKFEALVNSSIGDEANGLIAALLSVPSGDRFPTPNLSPQRRRERTLEAVLAHLATIAGKRSVLAVFEDAHWMDPTSRELLDLMVHRVRNLPVLLLITYRPEFAPTWVSNAHTTTLVLNRLSSRQVIAMADQITNKPFPREVHDRIIGLSDGVPLFVEELVRTVLENGLLHELAEEFSLRDPLPPLAVPDTLQGLLLARLDRLGSAKQVAQTGAALGREFSYEAIHAVADWLPEQRLQEALEELVQSELLHRRGVPPDSSYSFRHTLLQDAAHETLLRGKARELHARIARVLEERFPEIAEQRPELLAHHYTEAGLIEQAVLHWAKAGRQSAARSAMVEAEGQLRRALQLLSDLPNSRERRRREFELQVNLAMALMESKGQVHPEVTEVLGHARSLIAETEAIGTILHFSVLYGLWVAQYLGGERTAALKQANEFLSLAESQTQSGLMLVGHRLVGSSLIFTGNYPAAFSHLDRAVALYRPGQHQELAFRFGADMGITAMCSRALALWHRGYFDQARKAADEGLRQARQSTHRHTLAYALVYVGLMMVSGRWAAGAEDVAKELTALTREQGFPLLLGYGLLLQGGAMTLRGEGNAAAERFHEGAAAMKATGVSRSEPMALCYLAEALALNGATAQGLQVIGAALAEGEVSGTHWVDAELHRLRGDLLGRLPTGDRIEIETCFRTSLSVAREQGSRGFELRAAVSLAGLLSSQGRRDEARDLLLPVHGWFTEGFETPDLQDARAVIDDLSA